MPYLRIGTNYFTSGNDSQGRGTLEQIDPETLIARTNLYGTTTTADALQRLTQAGDITSLDPSQLQVTDGRINIGFDARSRYALSSGPSLYVPQGFQLSQFSQPQTGLPTATDTGRLTSAQLAAEQQRLATGGTTNAIMSDSSNTSQPASVQGLYKVQIPGAGPNGLPLYDVYGPQGKISGADPSVFQPGGVLYGVNIYNLPNRPGSQGYSPAGYTKPINNQFSITPGQNYTPAPNFSTVGGQSVYVPPATSAPIGANPFSKLWNVPTPPSGPINPFTGQPISGGSSMASTQATAPNYQSATGEQYYIAPGIDPRRESNYYKANDTTGQTHVYQAWDGQRISEAEFGSRGLNNTWINWQGTRSPISSVYKASVPTPKPPEVPGTITSSDFQRTDVEAPGVSYKDPNAPKSAVQEEADRRVAEAQAYNKQEQERKNAENLAQNPNTPVNNQGNVILPEDYIIENTEYGDKIKEMVNNTSTDVDLDAILKRLQEEKDSEGNSIASISSEIRNLKDESATIINGFRTLQDEIRNDPDFTKKLKASRGKFLEDEQLRQMQLFEDKLKNLNELKSDKEKMITERMQAYTNELQIETSRKTMLINALDSLQDREDDKAQKAKDTINSLMEHPELSKGMTESEVKFVAQNGYYPASLIKRIGDNYGTKFKSIFSITSGTQEVQYGLTEDGSVVELVRGAPKPTSGGGVNISYQTADGRRIEIIRDNKGNLISSTDIGSAGEETTQNLREGFVNWASSVSGQYSKKQLEGVAATFTQGDINKDTYLKQAIDNYASKDPWFGSAPEGPDPVGSFKTYRGGGGSTGSNIVNPQTGETFQVNSISQSALDTMLSNGWIIQ